MLRAGDLVYRVLEDVPHDDQKPCTWRVTSVVVASASAKQIRFKTFLPGSFIKRCDPDALGRIFFESPLRAIQHFLIAQRKDIVALDRRRKEAERAIAWAAAQEGVTP